MKQSFRKAVSALCAAAMLVSTLAVGSIGVFAEDPQFMAHENLAWTATVAVDSAGNNKVAAINDHKLSGDQWEATKTGRTEVDAWVSLTWGEAKTIDKLVVFFGGGTQMESNPEVQIFDGKEWKDVKSTRDSKPINQNVQYADANGDVKTQTSAQNWAMVTLTFEAQTTTSIRIIKKDFENNGNNRFFVREFEAYAPNDDITTPTNVAPKGTVVIPNAREQGSVKNSNLIDGNTSTRTVSLTVPSAETPAYFGVKWEKSYEISKVNVQWNTADTMSAVEGYTVEYSTDGGETYMTAGTTLVRNGLVDAFTLPTPVTANAVRISVTVRAGTGNLSVTEFEAIGITPVPVEHGSVNGLLNNATLYWGEIESGWCKGINTGVLTDGKTGRNDPASYSNWQKKGEGGVFVLGLTKPATLNKLVIYCESSKKSGSDYKIEYVESFNATDFETASKLPWTEITEISASFEDANLDSGSKVDDIIETLTFASVNVAALRITSVKTGAWVSEVEGFGPASAGNFAKKVEYESAAISGTQDLVDRLFITNVDDDTFGETEVVQISYSITRGQETRKGTAILDEAWTAIAMNVDGKAETVTAERIGAEKDQYITGMIFYDLLPTDTIEVSFAKISTAPVEE